MNELIIRMNELMVHVHPCELIFGELLTVTIQQKNEAWGFTYRGFFNGVNDVTQVVGGGSGFCDLM